MRPMIKYIKETKRENLVGCEIGVAQGLHALEIFNNLDVKKMYLIDPYLPYIDGDGYLKKKVVFDKAEAISNLSPYRGRCEFIYKSSKRAIRLFNNNFFDFIYIDDKHGPFKYVKHGIESWYSKVKIGGVIGGHDFDGQHTDVMLAVLDFVDENDIELSGLPSLDDIEKDWWMTKQ